MILVDTSVFIDYFKGKNNECTEKFQYILDEKIEFGITNLIYLELLQGARDEHEYKELKDYLETQKFYDIKKDKISYEESSKIYMKCRKKSYTIRSTIDLIICQTAIENELYLLHNDKDYDGISKVFANLRIY